MTSKFAVEPQGEGIARAVFFADSKTCSCEGSCGGAQVDGECPLDRVDVLGSSKMLWELFYRSGKLWVL